MKFSFSLDLTQIRREHIEQRQELVPIVAVLGEGMADLLGTQREIRTLLDKPSLADEAWGRLERRGR